MLSLESSWLIITVSKHGTDVVKAMVANDLDEHEMMFSEGFGLAHLIYSELSILKGKVNMISRNARSDRSEVWDNRHTLSYMLLEAF